MPGAAKPDTGDESPPDGTPPTDKNGDVPAPPPEPAPDGTPPAAKKDGGEPPPSPQPAPEDDQTKVKRRRPPEEIIRETIAGEMQKLRDELKIAPSQAQTPTAAPASAGPSSPPQRATIPSRPEAPDTKGWLPEEVRALQLAQFAERKHPDKYAGQSQKFVQFRRDLDEYVAQARKENPDRTLDDDDEEFMGWVDEHKPSYGDDEDTLVEEMREERAVAKARESLQGEVEQAKQTARLALEQPVVEGLKTHFARQTQVCMEAKMEGSLVPDIAVAIREKGLEQAMQGDPVFAPMVAEIMVASQRIAEEFIALSREVKPYNAQDPLHMGIVNAIEVDGQGFKREGGDAAIRTGRDGRKLSFITRAEWNKLRRDDPGRLAGHWTWDDKEILERMAQQARHLVENRTKDHLAKLKAAGWERPAASGSPKTESRTPSSRSAKAPASVAPGAAPGAAPQHDQGALSHAEFKALGYPLPKR